MTTDADVFLAAFERLDTSTAIHATRRGAIDRFAGMGLPTTRDEEWKYTDIRPISDTAFAIADDRRGAVTPADAQPHLLRETECHQLVFVNGRFDAGLSATGALPAGTVIGDLATALREDFAALEPFLARAVAGETAFTVLNTAFIEDGAVLRLPRGATIDAPIHLLFLTVPGREPAVTHPRILVVAEPCSRATIVETYAGLADAVAFTNTVTEIVAGEGSVLDHYKVERESELAYHVSALHVHQARSSNVTSHNYTFGGSLVRNEIQAELGGEDCEATFNGLYLGRGRQHIDNHLRVYHRKPHCRSWEYYKGILDDRSRAVFSGRIYVEQDAQKTDAKQTNQNLLLSDDAHVDTKPQLEIFADDVKCTHGATIGQLEESQLFYLRARGVPAEAARSLLIHGFAHETISEISIPEIRRRLDQALLERLPQGHVLMSGL